VCVQGEGKVDESPGRVVGGPDYFFNFDHSYRAYLIMNYRAWEDAACRRARRGGAALMAGATRAHRR